MKIHDYAAAGDVAGVINERKRGVSLESPNDEGLTPLMVAVDSARATVETIRALHDLGADLNAIVDESRWRRFRGPSETMSGARPVSLPSVLSRGVELASFEKIQVLLDAGADATYVNESGYGLLLKAVYRGLRPDAGDVRRLLQRLLDAGAPIDVESHYGESALSVASGHAQFGIVRWLLDNGADPGRLGWNDLFMAVAFGDVASVDAMLVDRKQLDDRERWDRTPFLMAVHSGRIDVAELLLKRGADLSATGRCGHTALMYAIESGEAAMLRWLIGQGVDVEETDEFGQSPLAMAASYGYADGVRALLDTGADPVRRGAYGESIVSTADTIEVVELLVERGGELADVQSNMRKKLAFHESVEKPDLSDPKCRLHLHPAVGRRNPERMNNCFWDTMIRSRTSAYGAASAFGLSIIDRPPVWCFYRYGQSLTRLPDGRFVEIAGEHEDFYDPDFCIYNDVVVHHGDGQFDVFGYPEEVFPPTDFHSATLVGDFIYVIGSLGYSRHRVSGETPVYRLHTQSFAIEAVACTGDAPGWIHRHRARLHDGRCIEIQGGDRWINDDLSSNEGVYRLDLASRMWTKL